MSHSALPRWIDIVEKDDMFTPGERAHLDELRTLSVSVPGIGTAEAQ